jgi:hypothetical protein
LQSGIDFCSLQYTVSPSVWNGDLLQSLLVAHGFWETEEQSTCCFHELTSCLEEFVEMGIVWISNTFLNIVQLLVGLLRFQMEWIIPIDSVELFSFIHVLQDIAQYNWTL